MGRDLGLRQHAEAAFAAQNNYAGYYLIPAKQFGNQFLNDLMS